MDKSSIRTRYIEQRNAISVNEMRDKSAQITLRTQEMIHWPGVKRMHVYGSRETAREVDTRWVEAYVYAMHPKIEVVMGDAFPDAVFPKGEFDLIIAPVVAFDDRLNRLGFGGGWYDKFIASQPGVVVIGLAYESQRAIQLVAEPHDMKLSYVVTETTTFTK